MLRQQENFGCGLYAVANALGLQDFVTEDRLSKSKSGVSNGQLNQYMLQDGINFFIDVLYCDNHQSALPKTWTELVISGDNKFMPMLLQSQVSDRFHLMGARLFQNGDFQLMDSLQEEPLICKLAEVNMMYDKVTGLYSFNHMADGDYVFF